MLKVITFLALIFITLNANKQITHTEPYYFSQWYIHYDKSFYIKNKIDKNAGIHGEEQLNNYTGKGIKIAIIDDDLDIYHQDLEGIVVKTYGINKEDKLKSNHGTAVTGIIAAQINNKGIRGIAPDAEILFIKHNTKLSPKEEVLLFKKAAEWGADIINCSWISYEVSKKAKAKIIDLTKTGRNKKGIIIVFSSGNGNQNNFLNESSIPNVISVGATNKYNKRAWYSNYGKNLDIMAPGGNYIGLPALDGFTHKYISYKKPNTFTGTSASAAIVSGIVALMLEKNPNLTQKEVENILKQTSDKIGNKTYINGRNNYYGYGKINVDKLMKRVTQCK